MSRRPMTVGVKSDEERSPAHEGAVMITHMDDPYPGRCRNHRTVGMDVLRCLDYEGVPHVCTFPEVKQRVPSPGVYSTGGHWKPSPWVKP